MYLDGCCLVEPIHLFASGSRAIYAQQEDGLAQDPGNPQSRWVTKMYEFLKKIAK
jgi:hypothetical protein